MSNAAGVRVVALMAAVGLVLGAIWLRGRIEGDDDPFTPDGPDAAAGLTLVCDNDLSDLCAKIGIVGGIAHEVAPPDGTLGRLAQAQPDSIVWLTLDPWPALVEDERSRAGRDPVLRWSTIARTNVVMTIWEDRALALESSCGTAGWDCLGQVAGSSWSEFGGEGSWGLAKPSHLDPTNSSVGLLVATQAVTARIGRPDWSLRDLNDDGFRSWFTSLARATNTVPSSGDPLTQQLQFGRAGVDAAGVLEAEAVTTIERVGERAVGLRVVAEPAPVIAQLLVAGPEPAWRLIEELAASDEVGRLLREAGWATGDLASGAPSPWPLTSPGAQAALQQVWAEVTR